MARTNRTTRRGAAVAWLLSVAACGDDPIRPEVPVASVEITPDTATRRAGDDLQLVATLRDSAGGLLGGRTVMWSTSAPGVAQVSQSGRVTAAAPGTATITAMSEGKSGTAGLTVWVPEVLVGAGDIAVCGLPGDSATAVLLDAIAGTVFTAGDNAYQNGSDADYANCYQPTWGRHKARTRPAPGNHEYQTPEAEGYFNYFGASAGLRGQGYYSYELGMWHVIVLNSNIPVVAGSEQEQWLRADLAATPKLCVLAYWHHPLFNSGNNHGNQDFVRSLWDALFQYGADVVVVGHEHVYERFAPQRPDGVADPANGIRQFTVGTGGAQLHAFAAPLPNSESRGTSHGVIKLTLRDAGYDWAFVPIAGESFTDSGTGACHGRPE